MRFAKDFRRYRKPSGVCSHLKVATKRKVYILVNAILVQVGFGLKVYKKAILSGDKYAGIASTKEKDVF